MSKNSDSQGIIESRIFLIRGKRVMLDSDLANLYGVETKRLNEQVNRNRKRFPADFMLQLTKSEMAEISEKLSSLRSQIATSNRGGRRYRPLVFTEQGVAMLSSVLNSERAIEVNIRIMRAFVKLRELMITHKDLAQKIEALERKYREHDENFKVVFEAIRKLMKDDEKPKRGIGFHT